MEKADAAPSGLLLLHKQPGLTSFDSLRDIKHALGTGKAGHTGTLDKFAEGLLLVLVGRALKLSQWFSHCDKEYEGTICFGIETDTLDPEGKPIAEAALPSREAVEQALAQFRGEIQQAPPAYSAIHIDGKRASALARKGEAPEMQKRPVTIYRLELCSWESPFAKIFVHCSSGTYIRSLARDIALAAGTRAYLSALVRTRVAGFRLEDAKASTVLSRVHDKRQHGKSPDDGYRYEKGELALASVGAKLGIRNIDKSIFEKLNIPIIDITPENAKNVAQGKPLAKILCDVPAFSGELGNVAALFSRDELIAVIEKPQLSNKWNYGYVYANN
ncbi:MAG: tRNA pseudouridine(55) synthase TruB [Treponema sp.]|jgi:tRNA pseudouridine55 synthase|nr:tRNA pseudouridine(55) synthase TruB [Treponema sp.]